MAAIVAVALAACAPQPRFGNFGGPYQPPAPIKETPSKTGILWHPIQARFAPNGDYLMVNLCRSSRAGMNDCRLAEYWFQDNRWRLLPIPAGHSHMWPSFSPDGQQLVFVDLPCNDDHQCNVVAGQLATMPAHGGTPSLLPVWGVRGPVFHPEGRRIAYWRYYGINRLASGRTSASEAIYEFDTATGQEKSWLENSQAPLGGNFFAFDSSIAGPFYHPDGDSLQFCGYRNGGWPLEVPVKCARLGRNGGRLVQVQGRALSPDAPKGTVSGTEMAFGTAGKGTFIGQSYGRGRKGMFLALIDSHTFEPTQELLNYGHNKVADADYSTRGRRAVALSGLLSGVGDRHVNDRHLVIDGTGIDKYAYPAMALIDLDTLQYQAIEWPNVEAIPND